MNDPQLTIEDFFVTIPTSDGSILHRNNIGEFYRTYDVTCSVVSTDLHLYELSNETIKDGDWCYDLRPDEDGDLQQVVYKKEDVATNMATSTEKKIRATTNVKLNKDGVPKIHKLFLMYYIKTNGFKK